MIGQNGQKDGCAFDEFAALCAQSRLICDSFVSTNGQIVEIDENVP
jgi:hypothetical protein